MKKTVKNSKLVIWYDVKVGNISRPMPVSDRILQIERGVGDDYIIELIDDDTVGTNSDDIVNAKNYDIYIEENVEKYGWERVCNCDDINDAIDRLNEYESNSCNPIRIGIQRRS